MNFFSLDSPFHKYGTMVFDMVLLNLLWLFTSVLSFGFLFPLASAGLFHGIYHVVILEEGYTLKTYFSVFQKKIIRSLGLTLMTFLLYGLALLNIWSVWSGYIDIIILLPIYLFLLFEIIITMTYSYALLGETQMTLKLLMKYGFLLANKHLLASLICVITIIALVFTTAFSVLTLFFLVAPAYWLMTIVIHKGVLSKYHLDKLI
ncbi:hypothetical protein [Petrocella sp. FN5]|uniref:hypothetical protein n=1 Tax=Petrocella sp. FN5 TaxID=3032002 RepID=UPI0023DA1C6B|nr:hypothetical protein [Petrocella sp. FN5]MDF1617703.1 hypothetical protein [Petrocella sp. FN5]